MAAHLSSAPHASSLVLIFPRLPANGLRWEGSAFGECLRLPLCCYGVTLERRE
jgi:hypothetical protein